MEVIGIKRISIALMCVILVLLGIMNSRRSGNGDDNILSLTKENCQVGNTITYGAYPQYSKIGKDPIEWQVLTVTEDTALLISKYILDTADYSQEWLNQQFYCKAFNDSERERMLPIAYHEAGIAKQDFVIYPSKALITDYCDGNIDRKSTFTDYVKKKKAWKQDTYWLLGEMCVDESGVIDELCYIPTRGNGYGVRPVIRVQLNNTISSVLFKVCTLLGIDGV